MVGPAAARKHGQRQGDFLAGKYLLEECLGIGGMGEVYRATNVSLGRKVAIKLLNTKHASTEDDVLRFLREARAGAAVRHPNVVDVLDVARDDEGTPFIVQELLSGQDLEQHLDAARERRLSIEETLAILIPVAEAVAAAHSQDVFHRDLKPANIFLAREGNRLTPKVLDFGACYYQTVGALSARERRTLIGTPNYMAPEQIDATMDVDARADVWALGVMLYELVVGETPFEAPDTQSVLKLVRAKSVPLLRSVAPSAPASLEAIVARCLARDRPARYANARAVHEELEGVRAGLRGGASVRIATVPEMDSVSPPDDAKTNPTKGPTSARASSMPANDAKAPPPSDGFSPTEAPSRRLPKIVKVDGRGLAPSSERLQRRASAPDEREVQAPFASTSRPIAAAPREGRTTSPDAMADPTKRVRTAEDVIREANEAHLERYGTTSRPPEARRPERTAADVIREAEEASQREYTPAPPARGPRTAEDVIREAAEAHAASSATRPPRSASPHVDMGSAPPTRRLDEGLNPDDMNPHGGVPTLSPPQRRRPSFLVPRLPGNQGRTPSPLPEVLISMSEANPPGDASAGASMRSPSLHAPTIHSPPVGSASMASPPMHLPALRTPAIEMPSLKVPSLDMPPMNANMASIHIPPLPAPPGSDRPWSNEDRAKLAAAIVGPALLVFGALVFVPAITAPLAHAMRGDSPLASGIFAVLTLVGAAVLTVRALGPARTIGLVTAAISAVLLGIVMIIVTFSASESAELGISPAAAGIVPFIAPLVPLGLAYLTFERARGAWLSPYEQREALTFVALTSVLLFVILETSPIGAVLQVKAPSPPASPSAVQSPP